MRMSHNICMSDVCMYVVHMHVCGPCACYLSTVITSQRGPSAAVASVYTNSAVTFRKTDHHPALLATCTNRLLTDPNRHVPNLVQERHKPSVGFACRFRNQKRLPPTYMEGILQQELHVCKADVCCIGYKMYLGSTRLFRLGQRINQASHGCFA